jgi:hypothetical protein
MSLDETLKKVERDVERGDLGKARDRLHGLLAEYPDDLSIRRRLGDVYSELRHPAMAGRYWYLEEEKTPDMEAACRAFEAFCGNDPMEMVTCLKFRGDIETLRGTYAGDTLARLQQRSMGRRGRYTKYSEKGGPKKLELSWWEKCFSFGCLALGLVMLVLAIIGVIEVIRWIPD